MGEEAPGSQAWAQVYLQGSLGTPLLGSGVFVRSALGRRCFCPMIKVCGGYRMVTRRGVAHRPSGSELCCGLWGPMAVRQG